MKFLFDWYYKLNKVLTITMESPSRCGQKKYNSNFLAVSEDTVLYAGAAQFSSKSIVPSTSFLLSDYNLNKTLKRSCLL